MKVAPNTLMGCGEIKIISLILFAKSSLMKLYANLVEEKSLVVHYFATKPMDQAV